MSQESNNPSTDYPESEYLPEDELRAVSREMGIARFVNYQEDCSVLRAKAYTKLMQHESLRQGFGWAIFYLENDERVGDTAMTGEQTEVLLLAIPHIGDKQLDEFVVPKIRIIINELFMTEDAVSRYYVQDFTLGPDNSANYMVSVAGMEEAGGQTLAPIFTLNQEGQLVLTGYIGPTPYANVHAAGVSAVVSPYGNESNLEDQIYALDQGNAILSRIHGLEPAFAGNS